jgi:hypothetical protein
LAFLVALSAASGCGLGADPFYGEPALPAWKPLSEETRRSLGTVQVVPRVDRRPSPSLRRPWVKSEASARLALKATGMTVGVAALCPPVIFMLPVMAGMGAVGGMNVGMSDRPVAAQKRRISAALLAVEPERRLASALIARSNSSPRGTTRLVAKSPAGGAVAVPPSPAPDTVLELTVWRYGLREDISGNDGSGIEAAEPRRPAYGRACARSARPPRPERTGGLLRVRARRAREDHHLLRKRGSRIKAPGHRVVFVACPCAASPRAPRLRRFEPSNRQRDETCDGKQLLILGERRGDAIT